eukprot:13253171-Alexandrium_andersonii.AAC.1
MAQKSHRVLPALMDFCKKAVGAMRHYGFRPRDGLPMPMDAANTFTREREQRHRPSRHQGGLGLACDASGWFNLSDFLRAFSYWYQVRDNRPLGTGRELTCEDFVAMVALNQGDEGRGGK